MDPQFTKTRFLRIFLKKLVQLATQAKLNAISDISDREKLYVTFREMFLQTKNGNSEFGRKLVIFKVIETMLSIYLLANEIDVLVTTWVNSGYSFLKNNYKSDHIIIKKIGKIDNKNIFIAMVKCETNIHFSGNNIQLPPYKNDPLRNVFAKQTNKNFFQRSSYWGILNTDFKNNNGQYRSSAT